MAWLLEDLPEALRIKLIHGSEGAAHLREAAGLAQEAGLTELASDLALAAWGESPLDQAMAGTVAALSGAPSRLRAMARLVSEKVRPPSDLGYYRRLGERRESAKMKAYLDRQAEKEPGNLFWASLGLSQALADADLGQARLAVQSLPPDLAPLAGFLAGDLAMFQGDPDQAVEAYARAGQAGFLPGLELRLGLAHVAGGQTGPAETHLRQALTQEPWRISTLLVLHDLITGADRELRPFPGRVGILLYTFNKAKDLDQTLASLADSRLDQAAQSWLIQVLDNASQDNTGEVLAAWADRLGPSSFRVITLPVNLGAPGARNWLISLEDTRACDFTVFLDDDVLLPLDWLSRLGAAMARYPGAGVWGCRVLDQANPIQIQSADGFLIPRPGVAGLHDRRFDLSQGHLHSLCRGQFAYLRPCATVTGCCHAFATTTLKAQGGFDLRYSPSQYDDLDHDIRLLLSGQTPVYQGHLGVRHLKGTGRMGLPGASQYDVGWANQFKLHHKFSPAQFAQAARTADEAAWADALDKWGKVQNILA